jgi:hypothetical protein
MRGSLHSQGKFNLTAYLLSLTSLTTSFHRASKSQLSNGHNSNSGSHWDAHRGRHTEAGTRKQAHGGGHTEAGTRKQAHESRRTEAGTPRRAHGGRHTETGIRRQVGEDQGLTRQAPYLSANQGLPPSRTGQSDLPYALLALQR